MVYAHDPGELRLEVGQSTRIGIITIEERKRPVQQGKELGLAMVPFGTQLDQFNKIGRGLGSQIAGAYSGECIVQDHFGQRMQIRSSTWCNLDFGFEKQIELP